MSDNRHNNTDEVFKNILVLSRYDRRGASSRLRTMQYIPYLERNGFKVEIKNLFDEKYLEEMYANRRNVISLAKYLFRRAGHFNSGTDLIWLEKEAFPWMPWNMEKLFWPTHLPIVTDYDDAIFHRYDQSQNYLVRAIFGTKIDRIMSASTCVFAGNNYIFERAQRAGASHIEIVPTVVDMAQYNQGVRERTDDRLRIGWIGTPETWTSFVVGFCDQIRSVATDHGAIFRVVGAVSQARLDDPVEFLPWSEDTEVSLIKGMDVGLMPLPDTPWTRGKCGYKLIQYMACGLPVVASPVGVNAAIVEHGVNGYLASTDAEWRQALATLLADSELRRKMGAAGRKKVEENYSLQVWGPRVAELLRGVLDMQHAR